MSFDLFKLLRDRRFWRGTWVWVLVLFFAVNVGAQAWYKQALEEQKKSLQADFEGEQKLNSAGDKVARYDLSCGQNLGAYWGTVPDGRKMPLVILSGMSQMHTINNYQAGDQLICQWMDDALTPKGVRVWGFAAPNLCNEEAVFQLVSLLTDPAKKPRTFIYGLCFDKMRNTDLRVGYQQFLREHPEIQAAYAGAAQQFAGAYPLAAAKMVQSLADVQKTQAQQSESFESHLREEVGKGVPLVAARKDLNAWAQIRLLLLRNEILHIKPESKRPVIQSRYEMNFQFLRLLADLAKANDVQFICYIIPLNPQAENPYITTEYEKFKKDAEAFCAGKGIPFANFENLVPAELWGTFLGGPDFKHFKGPGHKLTAETIVETFGRWLVPGSASAPGGAAK